MVPASQKTEIVNAVNKEREAVKEDISENTRNTPNEKIESISSEARRVYDAIKQGETVSTDELCIRLGLLPYKILPYITELEIEGLVINTGARNYRKA